MDSADKVRVANPRKWLSPVMDLVTVAGYMLLLPLLTELFTTKSELNGLLVLSGYTVLCIATWHLGLLKPLAATQTGKGEGDILGSGCSAFLSLSFGIVVVLMLIELSGSLDDGGFLDNAGTGESVAESLYAILILVISLVYLFVTMLRPKPVVEPGTRRHTLTHLLGAAGVNSMFLITLAFWDSYFADAEPVGGSTGLHILLFLVFYVVMLMFLAPPRLIVLSVEGNRWGVASFGIWLAVYCWNMTA